MNHITHTNPTVSEYVPVYHIDIPIRHNQSAETLEPMASSSVHTRHKHSSTVATALMLRCVIR